MPTPRILLFAGVALCLTSWAAAAEPMVLLQPTWKAGDVRRLECLSVREREMQGRRPQKRTIREVVDCKIVSVDDDGLVIDWKLLDGEIQTDARDTLMEAIVNLWKGQSLIVELNHDGTVRKLRNVAELKNRLEFAIEAILDKLHRQGVDRATTARIGRQLLDTFATEQVATTTLTRDIALYYALLGKSLSDGQPYAYETQLKSPLGGDPIPALGEFAITTHDSQQQRATITRSQIPDAEKAGLLLGATARQLASRLGRPLPNDEEAATALQMRDTSTFEVDLATGWVESLVQTRESILQDYVERDTKEIRIVAAE